MPAASRLAATIAAAALLAGLAGCGGSDTPTGKIPAANAALLQADLNAIRSAADCSSAKTAVDKLSFDIDHLPSSAGVAIKDGLRSLSAHLKQLVESSQQCQQVVTGPSGFSDVQPPPTTPTTTSTSTSTTTTTSTTSTDSHPSSPGNGGSPPGQGGSGTGGSGGIGGGKAGGSA